jgi:hypothetical protein
MEEAEGNALSHHPDLILSMNNLAAAYLDADRGSRSD